jgi:hypothetical protein
MSGLNTPGEPDSPDDPDLAEIVGGGASAFGIAVVVSDAERQDIGEVAVLTLVSSVTAHTGGSQPGAEGVDVLISRMLAEGFALVDSFTPVALLELPTPEAWRRSVSEDGMRLAITEPDGAFYLGEMGASPPPGWYDALTRRQRLVVLMASNLNRADSIKDSLDNARQFGNVVGALLPVTPQRPDNGRRATRTILRWLWSSCSE